MDCIKIVGYDTLGKDGNDGIRYVWNHNSSNYYIESAAFSQRSKSINDNVCGYTTSVSSGCILSQMNLSCKFCRTGMLLPFGRLLSEREIAKQNVFMVLSDMYCSDHPELAEKQREFAYMGQGEPGFSYNQIRKAILLTDVAMKELGQITYRHIIATSGVPQIVKEYVNDLSNHFFSSRVTFHFSLHRISNRSGIMPINTIYPYQKLLGDISQIISVSGEKPCVGILLFNNFRPKNSIESFTTDISTITEMLSQLNPEKVRISFCEFNSSPDLGETDIFDPELSIKILKYALSKGFEAKLFSSFGKEEITACGMLGGGSPNSLPKDKWFSLEKDAEIIIEQSARYLNF